MGSGAGAGFPEDFRSGELDTGVRFNLFAISSDLFKPEELSKGTGAYSAFLKGLSRLLNSGIDFLGV